jgi:homoserine O-acetyltransferase
MDANDTLYQVASSRDYDPSAKLGDIRAPVMWVNSADDFINPPELGIAETEVKKIPHGRFVLVPIGPDTHGHGTHTYAVAWKPYLAELLAESGK